MTLLEEQPQSDLPKAEFGSQPPAVAQKHFMACGLACVAYETGVAYDEIVHGEPPAKLNLFGFLCPELVAKLAEHGRNYRWRQLSESERDADFKVGDIVFVEPSEAIPGGHFLARTPNGWMDPWINFDRRHIDISEAVAGFREELPGRAEYLVYQLTDQIAS